MLAHLSFFLDSKGFVCILLYEKLPFLNSVVLLLSVAFVLLLVGVLGSFVYLVWHLVLFLLSE